MLVSEVIIRVIIKGAWITTVTEPNWEFISAEIPWLQK